MATTQAWPAGRYRLKVRSFIGRAPGRDHEVLEPDTEITYDGLPGEHMEPVDEQARLNYEHAERHGLIRSLDPTKQLSLVVGEIDNFDMREAELMQQLEATRALRRGALAGGNAQTVNPAPPPAAGAAVPMVAPPLPPPAAVMPPPFPPAPPRHAAAAR